MAYKAAVEIKEGDLLMLNEDGFVEPATRKKCKFRWAQWAEDEWLKSRLMGFCVKK